MMDAGVNLKQKYLVTMEREVEVRQAQMVEIEVEATDEEEAMWIAFETVQDDAFDVNLWSVMYCEAPHKIVCHPCVAQVALRTSDSDHDSHSTESHPDLGVAATSFVEFASAHETVLRRHR